MRPLGMREAPPRPWGTGGSFLRLCVGLTDYPCYRVTDYRTTVPKALSILETIVADFGDYSLRNLRQCIRCIVVAEN